ncbi:nuclear transport factor 2 family protein [Rhizobiaceae bacterium n13]|uniref:Nuclear transport factor 2 family protein n=1 Tax=Ferirhizobium litorale TaxID=2927786 RepID=A0AAE3QBM5_9HYPH|nr:nuclear transport factor 2 family protein [Fererhizobium litorale]MDI7861941.1 nuclear transport factor 2 family protein [Fererhizobium litorale]MDI7922787.1 nuclear transport factor 2 family protein [Fererhizobium litorale]
MTDRSELEKVVHAVYAARDRDDLDAMMSYFDPSCSFRVAGGDRLDTTMQKVDREEALRATFRSLIDVWDLSGVKTIAIHVDGDTAFAHRAGEVRFVPTGDTDDAEYIDKITFRDGRVVEVVEFIDTLAVARRAGLV